MGHSRRPLPAEAGVASGSSSAPAALMDSSTGRGICAVDECDSRV